jgi:carboxymethylenebutenolidase
MPMVETQWNEEQLEYGTLEMYQASPQEGSTIGLVLVQEIFGVNSHIRTIAQEWAESGFTVLAPSYFDIVQKTFKGKNEYNYDKEGLEKGRKLVADLGWEKTLAVTRLAGKLLQRKGCGRIGILGYCWGGSVAWRAATQLGLFDAAVCYYGRQIVEFKDERPECPVLMHFGAHDPMIPMDAVLQIRKSQKQTRIETYEAGHGFNCRDRAEYVPVAAAQALKTTVGFFETHGFAIDKSFYEANDYWMADVD